MTYIREIYLDKMKKCLNNDFVKIITGVRRCGKSSMFEILKNYLIQNGTEKDKIIEINFEKDEFQYLTENNNFSEFIKSKITDDSHYFLFVDEIQEVENWAKKINSVRTTYNCDIFISGSNSRLFSGEHLTYISGRYIEIKMLPLSFSEYLQFQNYDEEKINANKDSFLFDYIENGSFPAVALVQDEFLKETIISGLFDSIFARDIILRGKIKNDGAFMKVAKFVFENIGSQISANSVANTLKSQGHKISVDAVDNYLNLMCSSFVLYNCQRFNIRGKERLRTNGKYYCIDTSIRSKLVGKTKSNLGHILENLVFLELLRRGYEITTGIFESSSNGMEVDFIANKTDETIYFQVSQTVLDETTLERELKPFYSIKDNFPKYLLTLDRINFSKDGIIHKNLVDWLLENER